jgi:DNA primase
MAEAGTDPIRRSEVIRNIVESVAKVPDPIKQATYVRGLSQIMQVDEAVLMSEVNKLKRNTAYKANEAAQRRQDAENEAIPGAATTDEQQGAGSPLTAAPIETPWAKHEFQERDVIRVLLQYGEEPIEKNSTTSLASMLVQGTDEFVDAFENETYQIILAETKHLLQLQQPVTATYFLMHADERVSRAAAQALQSPWVYSPQWELKGLMLQSQKPPQNNFINDARQALMRFKLRKVEALLVKNIEEIKNLESTQADSVLIERKIRLRMKLTTFRNELAAQLGTVVL